MPFQPHPRPILVQPSDPTVRFIPLTKGYISKSIRNKSGYRGVSWNKKGKVWHIEGRSENKRAYIGSFPGNEEVKIEAAHAYDRWVIEHGNPSAFTNFPR